MKSRVLKSRLINITVIWSKCIFETPYQAKQFVEKHKITYHSNEYKLTNGCYSRVKFLRNNMNR